MIRRTYFVIVVSSILLMLGATKPKPATYDQLRELAAKLAASEAARIASDKARIASEKALAAEQVREHQALAKSVANNGSTTAAVANNTNAIQTASDIQIQAIHEATDAANNAAGVAKYQADEARDLASNNFKISIITQAGVLLAGGLAFLGTWLVAARDRRWAKKDAIAKTEIARTQTALIKQVHTLVNSDKTALMESELVLLKSNLALLQSSLKTSPHNETDEINVVIQTTKKKIYEMSAQLDDRLKQTEMATSDLHHDMSEIAADRALGDA